MYGLSRPTFPSGRRSLDMARVLLFIVLDKVTGNFTYSIRHGIDLKGIVLIVLDMI